MQSRKRSDRIDVQSLVETLGADTVVLLDGSSGEADVGESRIWDQDGIGDVRSGDLVLGINVSLDDAEDLVARLGAAGAGTLAVKGDVDNLAGLARVAAGLGVAVLAVAPSVSWEQFYARIYRATTGGSTHDALMPTRDLFALANAIAANIGAAITIEDPAGGLLAYSNLDQPIDAARRDTILGRNNPVAWSRLLEDSGYYRKLSSAIGSVVRVSDSRGVLRDRMAVLVKAGAEVLGSIWAVEGDERFDARSEQSLREATRLAALTLLTHRTFVDSTRDERGTALRDLLQDATHDSERDGTLGIGADVSCSVVAFRLITHDDEVESAVARSRIVNAINLAGEAFRRRLVCTSIGDTVYALFPSTTVVDTPRLVAMAQRVCEQFVQRPHGRLVAGVSAVGTDVAGARECRREADRVVQVLMHESGRCVAALDDVRVASALLTLADVTRSLVEFRLPGIDELIAHDRDRATQYVDTLRAYIDCGGNIPAVAARLELHSNTIRYRLGRLQQISGLSLGDPANRLVAAVDLLTRT